MQSDLFAGELRISEMQTYPKSPNPQSSIYYKGEWFEVINRTSEKVDLYGLVVGDYDNQSFTVDKHVIVEPGEYFVFGVDASVIANGGLDVDYAYQIHFPNLATLYRLGGEDGIILTSSTGVELDEVSYFYGQNGWGDGIGSQR